MSRLTDGSMATILAGSFRNEKARSDLRNEIHRVTGTRHWRDASGTRFTKETSMRWLGAGLSVCCSLLGAIIAFYIFAFASMVDPQLDALTARLRTLEGMLSYPGPAIVTVGSIALMLGGVAAFCLCLGKSHE